MLIADSFFYVFKVLCCFTRTDFIDGNPVRCIYFSYHFSPKKRPNFIFYHEKIFVTEIFRGKAKGKESDCGVCQIGFCESEAFPCECVWVNTKNSEKNSSFINKTSFLILAKKSRQFKAFSCLEALKATSLTLENFVLTLEEILGENSFFLLSFHIIFFPYVQQKKKSCAILLLIFFHSFSSGNRKKGINLHIKNYLIFVWHSRKSKIIS